MHLDRDAILDLGELESCISPILVFTLQNLILDVYLKRWQR